MTTIIKKDNKSIKVKVFYTLRGSKSTRLTTFSISNNDENNNDLSLIPIPLKTCLWSICSSSPDMICRDHDLSIYTANFHESGHGPSEKRDSLIWEGHGLMTWIMDQSREDIQIYGKSIDTTSSIDIYIELQPTMKWIKDDYFSALRNKSFEQFRTSTQTPLHPICNCYNSNDASYPRQQQQLQQQSSPPSLPFNNKSSYETEFDRYLRQRLQQTSDNNSSSTSPPLPSRTTTTNNTTSSSAVPVFRPEPIFPTSSSSTSSTINNNNNNNNNEYNKRSRLTSPSYYKQEQDAHHLPPPQQQQHHGDLTLPIPMAYNNNKKDISRRSAFTIASISDNNNKDRYFPPSNSNSSTSSSASPPPTVNRMDDNNIPVIYTPSNKKRKKNPIIMSASSDNNNHHNTHNNNTHSNNNNNSTSNNNNASASTNNNRSSNSNNNSMYQQQKASPSSSLQQQQQNNNMQQQQQQQVNTVVRTYYEVDRDNQGAYILPVEIDSWTVVDLGTVIYERPAYHNQRYIYPANYTVRKWYRSMVDPKSDTQYTCRILENGREPKFEVTADDCPMTYSGPTPTTVWTIIVRRAFAIRNQEYGHNPVGPDFFGLRKNTIAKMIQDLPNASKCSQYVWQTFEPARFNKPGRNRRRADSTLPGSLLGGVNYGLTSSRLIHNTNLTPTQHSYRASNCSANSSPIQQQEQSFIHSSSSSSSPTNQTTNNNEENNNSTSSPRINNNHRPSIVETA